MKYILFVIELRYSHRQSITYDCSFSKVLHSVFGTGLYEYMYLRIRFFDITLYNVFKFIPTLNQKYIP